MSETTFRLARLGEDAAIIDFINDNFDMRLPLLNRPELYHHYYAGRGGVPQFAVAEEDGRYVSAAGYILANTRRKPDIWVSVWVAAKGHNGVGLELMNALPGLLNADVVACNNIRPNTCTFYQFLGWRAERLPHYYRLGRRRAYYLAKPLRYSLPPVQRDLGLAKVEDAADLIPLGMPATPHTPRKDVWYMRRRYFHYPHFKYDVWAACENNKLLAYVVTRTVSAKETGCAAVVRLVDFIGEDSVLPRLGAALDAILNREGAEYMDCYNAGIPADVWLDFPYTVGLTTLVEAYALGIPVVCSRNPNFEIDIDKEGIGIAVEYGDVEGWVKAIRYLSTHPEKAREMGENARKLGEKRFNLEIFSKEIAQRLLHISTKNS